MYTTALHNSHRQRELERKAFQDNLAKLKQETEKGIVPIEQRFQGHTDFTEERLKASTVKHTETCLTLLGGTG